MIVEPAASTRAHAQHAADIGGVGAGPAVRAASTVVTSTPAPSTSSINRLRSRAVTGLGRRLWGTAHARLNAFWVAPAAPRQP
jgi:hypothetical protein